MGVIDEKYYCGLVVTRPSIEEAMEYAQNVITALPLDQQLPVRVAVQVLINTIIDLEMEAKDEHSD